MKRSLNRRALIERKTVRSTFVFPLSIAVAAGRPPDGLRPGALPAARARRRGDPRRADADALRCTHARTVFAGSHTAAPQLEDSKPPLSLWQKEGQWAKQVRVNDEFANEGDGFASTVFPKR